MIAKKRVDPASRRIVMLGASNLTRSISMVIETAQIIRGRRLEVLTAMGHGRSYGMESSVLGRTLPGIVSCGLWDVLQRQPSPTAMVLLTDIGNDLLYGASVDQIANWIDTCFARLAPLSARTVVTTLPIESLKKISKSRYRLMRNIFFPQSRLKLPEALELAQELNQRILELANHYQASVVRPLDEWYRVDPIHIQRKYKASAWQKILSPWSDPPPEAHAVGSFRRWLYLRQLRPLQRRFLGFQQHQPQPAGKLPCGSTIALY